MKGVGRSLGTGLLFCVAAAVGGLIARGDAAGIARRCQRALVLLISGSEPAPPSMAAVAESENDGDEGAADPSQFRGALRRVHAPDAIRTASAANGLHLAAPTLIGFLDSSAQPPGAAAQNSISKLTETTPNGLTVNWDAAPSKQPTATFGKNNLTATIGKVVGNQAIYASDRQTVSASDIVTAGTAVSAPFGDGVNVQATFSLAKGGNWNVFVGPSPAAPPQLPPLVPLSVPTGKIDAPKITYVKNGKFAAQKTADSVASTPINTYGGYVELIVESSSWAGASLAYVLAEKTSGNLQGPYPITPPLNPGQPPGPYAAKITNLPINGTYNLFVLLQTTDDHRYSSNSVQVATNAASVSPTPPKILQIDGKDVSSGDGGKVTVGKKQIKVSGGPITDTDAQVLVFADDSDTPVNGIDATTADPSNATNFLTTVKVSKTGDYSLRAAFARGAEIGPRSDPVPVTVRTQGPRVTGLVPPDFGTNPKFTTLRIEFAPDSPLDQSSAENPANYVLSRSNGTGTFGQGRDTPVAGGIPTFDPQTNSVSLSFSPTEISPDVYQLVIRGRAVTGTAALSKAADATPTQPAGTPTTSTAGNAPAGGTPAQTSSPASDETAQKPLAAASGVKDVYGNSLEGIEGKPGTDFTRVLANGSGADENKTKFVVYPEYTPPRPENKGFNPSDRVDTRVARLYYYRDAHRVAQIINRDIKAMNKAGADMAQQLAEQARTKADAATDDRQASERAAVHAAQESRAAEKQLQAAQAKLAVAQQNDNAAQQTVANVQAQLSGFNAQQSGSNAPAAGSTAATTLQNQISTTSTQLAGAQQLAATTNAAVQSAQQGVATAQAAVQAARAAETKANEDAQAKTAVEDHAKEDQFRKEVAAAHEDPDTFAAGKPDSVDPVQQVSVSVIGEGLIQLRGPVKGINTVRLMINEIDTPVGQVNVAVHTVQVNGEHGDRMEKVLGKIEKYIDHSRFLTAQSAQMLRNAVVTVASQKAEMAMQMSPDGGQDFRDQKYLDAFFGKDFVDELRALDSEFLKTGNKLLTLHSMDSTSLSSALFLLALAKNSVRQEILAQFEQMTRFELPRLECEYFQAGGGKKAYGCGKFHCFSTNARFTSLIGQFNNQVYNDDTLTPLQREFIRLAQIFKSRLVTEMEINERVMERSLIEQRISQAAGDADAAKTKAQDAKRTIASETQNKLKAQQDVLQSLRVDLQKLLDEASTKFQVPVNPASAPAVLKNWSIDPTKGTVKFNGKTQDITGSESYSITLGATTFNFTIERCQADPNCWQVVNKGPNDLTQDAIKRAVDEQIRVVKVLKGINLKDRDSNQAVDADVARLEKLQQALAAAKSSDPIMLKDVLLLADSAQRTAGYFRDHAIQTEVEKLSSDVAKLTAALGNANADVQRLYQTWKVIRVRILTYIRDRSAFPEIVDTVASVEASFKKALDADNGIRLAQQKVETANQILVPLDHKKFLDMLIDEAQEKLIELLEGTRAHTANVDNYIKRLTTALDDDFNTQFYHPAFREVRSASRMWDVNLGDIETTSILTNNRAFAKVSPQATMEFDLPKRDILIKEAFAGTKALFDDYGALLQDPTFLALSKLNSGLPTSSPNATGGSASPVRNVLPTLPSQTDEKLLGQPGPGSKQFGSALEALIPDPAVYKFETGTGFEIRPVVQPDGQAVTFHFNYMYTTNVREPVRADEKHLGRVKRHFIDTDVQLSNFELRKVSRYLVALKASRTARGVPLLEDVPGLGALFRPLPSAESSLQQNLILAQATIFPTLFDLMGLRWAPAIADLDALRLTNDDFIVRGRRRDLGNRVFDISSSKVDTFLGIPEGERRSDLYRSQETTPTVHPNGYHGPGLNLRDSQMQEGFDPTKAFPETQGTRGTDRDGVRHGIGPDLNPQGAVPEMPLDENEQGSYRARRPVNLPAGYTPPASTPVRRSGGPVQRTTTRAKPMVAPPADSCRPVMARARSGAQALPEPRRLPPQIVSGEIQVRVPNQPSSPRTVSGEVVPAEYTAPEVRPATKPKKSGFPWFRKNEKE